MNRIIALDQSTAGTKAALLDNADSIRHMIGKAHRQMHPAPDRMEHDTEEIWQNSSVLLLEITKDAEPKDIIGLDIANLRENTVVWDRKSEKLVTPAIAWQDVRAKALTDGMHAHTAKIETKTGLKLSPYYSVAKAAAQLQEQPSLRAHAEKELTLFGVGRVVLDKHIPGPYAAPLVPVAVYSPAISERDRKLKRGNWANAHRRCQ